MNMRKVVTDLLISAAFFLGGIYVGREVKPLPAADTDPYVHLQCVSPQGQGGYDAKSIEPLGYMMWKATTNEGDEVILYSDSFSSCLLSKASPALDTVPAE